MNEPPWIDGPEMYSVPNLKGKRQDLTLMLLSDIWREETV